ncbi:MAG: phosphopentomutase [Lachnospiraceae bacterium]|nr:phosphopentomutase [Lachnospiraceae bacterium]MBP5264120.1 phosphopentomutase [Lachnospiraceae bacterium]MBP5733978.1 phosphopentomutase [Lachnospiraceae bacterium]
MKRVFLIVLDSFGIGEEPDAPSFGDWDVNTLRSVAGSPFFRVPNLQRLGLFNIDGVTVGEKVDAPKAAIARLRERSMGKDTTIGHWEIAGLVSEKPLPTYPNGFPKEVLEEFSQKTGRGVLCNLPYSGTAVIQEYGKEHMETGSLIVYTSADSVFQIAAHEEIVPLEELYEDCRIARKILVGEHGVGRVIARPFVGPKEGPFVRTAHRHDFSLLPPKATMLDHLKDAGKDVIAVGKIMDIFAGSGITEHVYTSGNEEGIERTLEYLDRDFEGLCFVNLVDYDMLYGHRRDVDGYAKALTYFDEKLPELLAKLGEEDVLMITADHGCDPAYLKTTDHTREYVPLLAYGPKVPALDFGTRETFADIAATVLSMLGVKGETAGKDLFAGHL